MRTTVAIHPHLRDRLNALKHRWGAKSIEEVIERLVSGGPQTPRALYESRKTAVDAVLKRHGIKRLVAFGSRARGDARPDSDLDLAGTVPKAADLFDIVHMRDDLEEAFGLPVDFVVLGEVRPRLKKQIDKEGVVLVA